MANTTTTAPEPVPEKQPGLTNKEGIEKILLYQLYNDILPRLNAKSVRLVYIFASGLAKRQ